jgi:hypothetical protein
VGQTSSRPQPTTASRDESLARLRAPLPSPAQPPSAAWQGWTYFGAAVMALMGLFWAVMGFVALFDRAYFTFRTNRLLAIHDYAPWGWVHLVGGLLALAAGAGILWGVTGGPGSLVSSSRRSAPWRTSASWPPRPHGRHS